MIMIDCSSSSSVNSAFSMSEICLVVFMGGFLSAQMRVVLSVFKGTITRTVLVKLFAMLEHQRQ